VVARSADLTVVLVNDYLEWGLAELNLKNVSDGTPWLLVQPSGAFPLVGACVHPGRDGLLDCLFDRMIRNREGQRFSRARRRTRRCYLAACSQYPRTERHPACRREIAKASLPAFVRIAQSHCQFDLLGSTVANIMWRTARNVRPAAARSCLDPRRAPAPIELSAGAKLVMTSGGYRSRHITGHGGTIPQACEPADRRGHPA